jgi:hypothetical protein
MMGAHANDTRAHGIIPRLGHDMFARIRERVCNELYFKVEVSYMEIYNEHVRDLLDSDRHVCV